MEHSSGSASSFSLAFSFCRETEIVSEIKNRIESSQGDYPGCGQQYFKVTDTEAALKTLIPPRSLSGYLDKSNQIKEVTDYR